MQTLQRNHVPKCKQNEDNEKYWKEEQYSSERDGIQYVLYLFFSKLLIRVEFTIMSNFFHSWKKANNLN